MPTECGLDSPWGRIRGVETAARRLNVERHGDECRLNMPVDMTTHLPRAKPHDNVDHIGADFVLIGWASGIPTDLGAALRKTVRAPTGGGATSIGSCGSWPPRSNTGASDRRLAELCRMMAISTWVGVCVDKGLATLNQLVLATLANGVAIFRRSLAELGKLLPEVCQMLRIWQNVGCLWHFPPAPGGVWPLSGGGRSNLTGFRLSRPTPPDRPQNSDQSAKGGSHSSWPG